jgi:hypothetical protein
MIQTLIGSEAEKNFYKNKFYFSYSGINKLLYSPSAFYNHYILNEREDKKDAHLVGGSVLHCLLLDPEEYDNKFIDLPGKLPTDSQKKLIDNIFKIHCKIKNNILILDDYYQDILTYLLTANLYQTLKTDQQRLDKILIYENQEYFEFLKKSLDKTIVDEPTLHSCKKQVELLKNNKNIRALLQLDKTEEDKHIEVFNELYIKMEHEQLPFGFHGYLDNIVIDNDSKTIFINDLKTTSKSIQDFPEAVEYYKYWIQAVIYLILVSEKFLNDKKDKNEWKIQVTFIVIDKYNLIYPYQVSKETMNVWKKDFKNVIDIAKWHYENINFELPYELANGNVKL